MERPVWLDMDPGHDDALALLVALPSLPVIALTTVAGNQTVEKTYLNARRIVQAADREVPVAPGYARPLFRPLVTAQDVHGQSGLEGYEFPPLPVTEDPPHALEMMASLLTSSAGPVDIIATGPQTNIAAFLIGYPHLRSKVGSVTFMGGALGGGNITPYAEFNIYVDPDAAQLVVTSGLAIRMVGLDVTHKALLHPSELDRFLDLRRPLGEMLYGLFRFFGQHEPHAGSRGMPVHDVLAVAAHVHPEFFRWKRSSVWVQRQENHPHLGATIVGGPGPAIDVAVDIDVDAFFIWLWDTLSEYRVP